MSLAVAVVIALVALVAIDSCFLPRKKAMVRILGKESVPVRPKKDIPVLGLVKIKRVMSTSLPIIRFVQIEVDGQKDKVAVDRERFDLIKTGHRVVADYQRHRLSQQLRVKGLSRPLVSS